MTPSPNYPAPMRIPKGRVKSYTPPIDPGHQGYNSSKPSSAVAVEREKPKEIDYFAGAKFDCLPSVSSLPTPPPEWTIPVLRSQSQPSSPVTTTVGVRIDVNSLFLTPQQIIKSASFPKMESSGITSNSIMMNKKRAEISNFSKNVAVDKKYQQPPPKQQQQQQMSKKRDNHYQKEYKKSSYSILTKNSSDDYKSFSAVTSPKLKSTEQSKPLDITATHLGSPNQRKQMYPHLTEHLRGLLKVQG